MLGHSEHCVGDGLEGGYRHQLEDTCTGAGDRGRCVWREGAETGNPQWLTTVGFFNRKDGSFHTRVSFMGGRVL